jgi:hypothetical protein
LIEASIENFGLKNDDVPLNDPKIGMVHFKLPSADAGTQISEQDMRDEAKSNELTQFGYLEKLKLNLMYIPHNLVITKIPKLTASTLKKTTH